MKYADYFKSIPVLVTPGLILRAFTKDDMQSYLKIIQEPDVLRYMGNGVQDFKDDGAVDRWLNNINNRILKTKLAFTWCIWYKQDERVIGRIDLGGFNMRTMAEISYHISADYWNRGLVTEAVRAVTDFGLEDLKLHRIHALVMPQNAASLKVLIKNGYEREGILRKYRFGREFHDAAMLSVIREENLSIVK